VQRQRFAFDVAAIQCTFLGRKSPEQRSESAETCPRRRDVFVAFLQHSHHQVSLSMSSLLLFRRAHLLYSLARARTSIIPPNFAVLLLAPLAAIIIFS